jgi:hypothetical protein
MSRIDTLSLGRARSLLRKEVENRDNIRLKMFKIARQPKGGHTGRQRQFKKISKLLGHRIISEKKCLFENKKEESLLWIWLDAREIENAGAIERYIYGGVLRCIYKGRKLDVFSPPFGCVMFSLHSLGRVFERCQFKSEYEAMEEVKEAIRNAFVIWIHIQDEITSENEDFPVIIPSSKGVFLGRARRAIFRLNRDVTKEYIYIDVQTFVNNELLFPEQIEISRSLRFAKEELYLHIGSYAQDIRIKLPFEYNEAMDLAEAICRSRDSMN